MAERRKCPHCYTDNYSSNITTKEWECYSCGKIFTKQKGDSTHNNSTTGESKSIDFS